eukprot:3378170-Pleurochrysis_carterae.AAC.2
MRTSPALLGIDRTAQRIASDLQHTDGTPSANRPDQWAPEIAATVAGVCLVFFKYGKRKQSGSPRSDDST